ncbi:hypothetical protein VNI00_008070 [Paramarasmius palmivorus]|uniref:Chalcone-flavonone isomerase family protein n=1 Tax=Paramarasmius palmivorus TaxID=297713 RepID=A0AAW0CYL1_9AGAR
MTSPWPGLQTHLRGLQNGATNSATNSASNGYSPLLFHLFPLEKFIIYSPINITAFPLSYSVKLPKDERAVFLLHVRGPGELQSEQARAKADEEIRKKAKELVGGGGVRVLHCVVAFGSKLAFYKLDTSSGMIEPEPSKALAIERWNNDVMSADGARKLKDVVLDIQKMLGAK